MRTIDVQDEAVLKPIQQIIETCGGMPTSMMGDLTTQMIQTCLKMMMDEQDLGQMKLITRALKEMRHAYRIFSQYPDVHRISIFGSARTPEDHPDYIAAKNFSIGMAEQGWMCITGAANGIMKAGLEGSQKASSFGLSIRLPFEVPTNSVIEGDPKSMMFRYFFTRKLMFMSHSNAVAVFPGGFGTLDELFEVLTLMHTGKSSIIPTVLVESPSGQYWKHWQEYINVQLLENGWISPEDPNLFFIASTPEEAVRHILHFYHRYHSSRYVKDLLVIRLSKPITDTQLGELNKHFSRLVQTGEMRLCNALAEELEHPELQRLVFHHTRKDFGLLRLLIDSINDLS